MRMEIISFFAIMACLLGEILTATSQSQSISNEDKVKSPLTAKYPACIDDTDCKFGDMACFKYFCYPWQTDVMGITCRTDKDCKPGNQCYRHTNKRDVNKGVCMKKFRECGRCKTGEGCCGDVCCDKKYYQQFAKLPCTSHIGCQDLNLGNYCCPNGNSTACCNTDPNPPTTIQPKRQPAIAGGSSIVPTTLSMLMAYSIVTLA